MRVLLATPYLSQHMDSGLFFAHALSQLGAVYALWDYRREPPPKDNFALFLGLKTTPDITEQVDAKASACYWPDHLARFKNPSLGVALLSTFDVVYTCLRPTPEGMVWLPGGWTPAVHQRVPTEDRYDSCFVGTFTPYKHSHLKVMQPRVVCGNGWGENVEPVYLHDMVALYSATKVIINVHRDEGIGLNRRLFEAMACGFTITDRVPGVDEVLGKELADAVAFTTPEEGKKLLDHYVAHPADRASLWQAEQEAIRNYSYEAMVQRVMANANRLVIARGVKA